ncbi:MAG TPA: N-acetyltransferase [Candidatus Binatia bacterium]|nr:N-acetyltransferase [Candidatus Binatia bacterium]
MEQPTDIARVREVHRASFPSEAEAVLVDRLRENGKAVVSLVAEVDGQVVGHIVFSPVSIEEVPEITNGLGLAPVAVLPGFQRHGVGSRLVQEGLAASRRTLYGFVVVLGEPRFYRRFGFRQASAVGLRNEYDAEEAFMVLELQAGILPENGGLVKYGPEFAAVAV